MFLRCCSALPLAYLLGSDLLHSAETEHGSCDTYRRSEDIWRKELLREHGQYALEANTAVANSS